MFKHIFLTGFMGAGKSRIGRQLAVIMDWPFKDSDKLIESEQGKSVKEIFEQDGEEVFRKLEKEMVKRLAADEYPAVIALGGGALLDTETFNRIMKGGLLIYIKSAPQTIYDRVKNSEKRPLLKAMAGQELLERIELLMDQRAAVYEQAHLIFDRDGLEADEAANKIYQAILKLREA